MELTGLKQDGAFVKEQFSVSERQACKLFAVDRSTYRYEARPDRNAQLRREMTELAHQKPQYGYRRLHAALTRRGYAISVMRLYRIYREEGLAVWRLKRKRLSRPAASQALHVRQNQEWALNFVADTISTGRGIRVLTIVDAFTRECVVLESGYQLRQQARHRSAGAKSERTRLTEAFAMRQRAKSKSSCLFFFEQA